MLTKIRLYLMLINFVLFALVFSSCSPKNKIEIQDLDFKIPEEWSFPIHSSSMPDEDSIGSLLPNDKRRDWWSYFNNPNLDTFLASVKNQSPDLRTLIQNEKISLNNARIIGGNIFPSVSASINSSESVQNLSAFGFADSFFQPADGDTTNQATSANDVIISFENKTYGLGINYQWEIDVWGRLLNERRAAKTDYEAVRHDLSYLGFSILVRSAILYFQGVEAAAQVALSEESYESLIEIRDLVKERYEKGLRSSLDYRLSETSVSTAILENESRKNQLSFINRQLQIILGKYPSGHFIKEDRLPDYLPPVPKIIPAVILTNRPDINSLLLKVEANGYRIAQAKRNLFPGLFLSGSVGTSTKKYEDILDENFGVWNLGLSVSAPLFNGNRLRSNLKIQEALFEKSKEDLKKGLLQAFSDVEQLLYIDQSLVRQIKAIKFAEEQSKDAYSLSKERYDKGVTTLESVLNSQRQYNLIRSQNLVLNRQSIENRLNLFLALGGSHNLNSDKK